MKNTKKTAVHKTQSTINPVHEAYLKLQAALAYIDTNEAWLNYLAFQAKFHSYSFGNTLLIYSQNPVASYVAGFRKWQTMDRYVRKGEHGIKILAPLKYKVAADGEEDDIFKLRGFRLVTVFDISQTDGSDECLPVLVSGLKGSFKGDDAIYEAIKSMIDIPVAEVDQFASKGCYFPADPRIEIRSDMSTPQKIKTLCHEFSHHLHHTRCYEDEGYSTGEVIAESAAYIVCSYLGIDTSEYSVGYVNSWSKDTTALQSVANKIQKISAEIIDLIDKSPAGSASDAEL